MFLSKIFFVLVGLLAGAATMAALVAPRSADRRIVELEGQRLDRAQYAAEQMLKTDAHRWIDYAAKLSRDAVFADALDSASKGAGEPRVLADTVKSRIRALVSDLVGIGLTTIGAVDVKGRVVTRVGEREGEYGDSIIGHEAIGDALRGYLTDDVWNTNGKLQRIAAVPVLSKGRDRIVGAIYVGAETGKRLADLWKRNLGVDVAVIVRGQVASASLTEATLGGLPDMIEQHKQEIASSKRTRPMSFQVGSERMLAVAAPFTGQAGEVGAYYVLVGKQSPASDPLALLTTMTKDDLKWGNFPWIPLGGGLLVVIVVGLYLQRLEAEKPLGRLRGEVQRLSRGEIQKLRDTEYTGKFGGIARDVNAAMERFTHTPPAKSETAKKDIGAILGNEAEGPSLDLSLPHFASSSLGAPSPFGHPSGPSAAPPPAPLFLGPGGAGRPGPAFPASALGATPQRNLASPPFGQAQAQPPPPPGAMSVPLGSLGSLSSPPPPPRISPVPPPPSLGAPSAGPSSKASFGGPVATLSPYTPRPVSLGAGSLGSDLTPIERPNAPGPGLPAAAAPAHDIEGDTADLGEPTRAVDSDENHMREVFAEYVATRERCGEPVANLTLEKFRAKLEANREQLVAKYACRSAHFSVYVKDGKAAIKAAPVR